VHKPWSWTQWPTLLLAAFTYVTILPMPETYHAAVNPVQTVDEDEPKQFGQQIKSFLAAVPFVRPLHMLIHEPVVCLFSLCKNSPHKLESINRDSDIAFNFAVVYCFSASIPFVFKKHYGFRLQSQGLVFISLIIG